MNAKKVFNIIILLSIGVGLSVMVYMKRDNNAFTNIKNNRNESDCREFLEKFPDSEFVPQVKQILEEVQYEDYSLPNGSQPYREFYGSNKSYAYGRPSVKVNASNSSDVLVIVRYNNSKGKVAGLLIFRKVVVQQFIC